MYQNGRITKGVELDNIEAKDLIVKIGAVKEFLKDAQIGPEVLKALDFKIRALLAEADGRRIANRRSRLLVHDL